MKKVLTVALLTLLSTKVSAQKQFKIPVNSDLLTCMQVHVKEAGGDWQTFSNLALPIALQTPESAYIQLTLRVVLVGTCDEHLYPILTAAKGNKGFILSPITYYTEDGKRKVSVNLSDKIVMSAMRVHEEPTESED